MAKRFTDTQKWQDEWFMELPCRYKLFWMYLLDNCDHAGIWKTNFKLASFHVGENLDSEEAKEIFAGRIYEFKDGYWFLPKFIKFQYGGIKNDAVGKSISKILELNNLNGAMEGLPSTYEGTKVKVKAKETVKVLEGGMGGGFVWDDERRKFFEDGPWQMKFCTAKRLHKAELDEWMLKFLEDIELRGDQKVKKELQSHFTNWFNKQKITKKPKNGTYQLLEELRLEHEAATRNQAGGNGGEHESGTTHW